MNFDDNDVVGVQDITVNGNIANDIQNTVTENWQLIQSGTNHNGTISGSKVL